MRINTFLLDIAFFLASTSRLVRHLPTASPLYLSLL
jgi:hypothetical protein